MQEHTKENEHSQEYFNLKISTLKKYKISEITNPAELFHLVTAVKN